MQEVSVDRLIALVAFAGTYLGLALGRLPFFRVDRTGVAIIGGAVVVVSGLLPWDRAVAAVDAHTLVLLFGMMIVAAYLRLSGFFRLVTYAAVRRAHTPIGLLALIIVAAGVLSALFVNDVVCLVMAPIVLDLVRRLRLPPVPYLIALATAANVGSVATLTGNPQNMLVGSFSGISYRAFLLREAPVAVIGLALVFAVIWLAYRRRLPPALPAEALDERGAVHQALMIKTMAAVSVMLVAFLAGRADRAGGHRRRRLLPADAAGESRQGLPRDRLGAPRALHRALRGDRRARGLRAGRRDPRLGGRGRPLPPGGAHGGDRGTLEPGLERARGAALQGGDPDLRRAHPRVAPARDGLHAGRATSRSWARSPTSSWSSTRGARVSRSASSSTARSGVPVTMATLLVGWLLLIL